MPRRPPTVTTGSAIALIAVLAAAGVAAHALTWGGDPVASSARTHDRAAFEIRGELARPLMPGSSQPLDLRITNRTRRRLRITRLTVSLKVDAAHKRAGCSGARSFGVTMLTPRQYPILVLPRRTRSLRALRVRPLPRVRMLNLPMNQNACKGARLKLRFLGRAERWQRIRRP